MNREILFKAKRKDNREWIYGYLVKENNKFYITENTDKFYEIILETISQYTGIKDKNSKKIFENDEVQAFCEFKETDVSGIVKFNLYNGLELEMFDGEVWHFDYLKDIEVIKSLFDEEMK